MTATYVLKRATNGEFMFTLKTGSGETILWSERYKAKSSATTGIQSVCNNSPLEERYERRISRERQSYFVLKAANGEIIGTSGMFSSPESRDHAIQAVKENGPTAILDDQT